MLQSDYESDFADEDTDKFCFYTEMSNFKIQVTKIFKDKTIILIKFLITCHLFLYFRNSICDGDIHLLALGLLCWLRHKRICLQCRKPGFSPGSGRASGEGNGYPLQYYSCLENSMDRGAWWAVVHGIANSRT